MELIPGVPPASRIGKQALSGRTPEELAFVAGRHLAFFREEGQVPHDELRRRDQADPFPNRYAPPPPGYRANGY